VDTDKTEITEGMSSEELDALTTGEDAEDVKDNKLAQEALDATEEGPSPAEESVDSEGETKPKEAGEESAEKEKPDVDPKDAVIGDFRRKLREQELETARLQGEIEARKSIHTTTTTEEPQKSPLEIAEAAYIEENGDLEGFAMTGELYRKQRAFDEKQLASKAAAEKQQQVNVALNQAAESLQEGDLSSGKMGKGLDLQSVANIGDKYLTKGDKIDLMDIQASRGMTAALKEAYKMMIHRTLNAGGEDAKLLQGAINAKSKSQTKPKKQGPTDIDTLTTEGDDIHMGEAETETHSKRLTDFIFSE